MVFIPITVTITNNCCKTSTKNSQRPLTQISQMWTFYICFQCIWYIYFFRLNCLSCRNDALVLLILQCIFLKTRNPVMKPQYNHQNLEVNIYTMVLSNLQTLFWILSFVPIMSLIAEEIQDDACPVFICISVDS